jgi:ribonucleoside-triphosphate reductase
MTNITLGLYESYIHKSRYARYLPNENRREHWEETVSRYVDFMQQHIKNQCNFTLSNSLKTNIYNSIVNMEVMPSMRALMTAGKALLRDNTAGYNCSYLPVDDPKAFDECMHILMNGTGVGFSVERQYINKLPEIPEQMFDSDTTIIVKDSKEGWSKALRMLVALLYSGEIPKWDTTRVRSAGTPLKTFGGRASGPEPLNELFKFVTRIFTNAKGRKLTSLECHDIMCKIAEVVVVGGVRRSAMISLSNLSDDRMRNAKSGAWWEANVQRALSNNSAVYTEKPEVGMFLEEWLSLYQSKSGERGIFSREAAHKVAKRNGRRDPNHEWGCNPCSEIILRPYQFCNLTEVIVRADDTEETLAEKVRIATILGTFQSTLTNFPYLRKIWQKNTEEERLLGVSMTGIYDNKLLNDYKDNKLPERLERLRQIAIDTNKEYAQELGIPVSASITCTKPSGTVSQLTDSASGIHPRHDPYYFRRVRSDNKDPLTKHMIDAGIPHEPDVTKPQSTTVFTFPKKAPEGAMMRGDVSAIDHLELWLKYQRHWCEHKPSVTISVKEEEWPTVGAWVWEHFDEMSGVSFLPYDGGTYRQAPYETVTQEQYEELLAKMPTSIDWQQLIEKEDNVEGVQTLACTAGGCEI